MSNADSQATTAGALPVQGLETPCCIVGGGPAGMMLGLLLARAGIEVVALEKHADFLRDFRGDTIHPSTLEVMWELGMLEGLLERPHQELRALDGSLFGRRVRLADFSHLPTHARFIALMPQWDFLDFIATQAAKLPSFRLFMESEVTDLLYEGAAVAGVVVKTKQGARQVRAGLTVAADGRGSIVRERAALSVTDYGAPIDVLWFRLSRRSADAQQPLGHVAGGRVLVLLERGDYWQCAFVIPKGSFGDWQARGIDELKAGLAEIFPLPLERLSELASWDQVKLLSVRVDRVDKWARPGLLLIGDAAHAMSPIGGVGINLAIQDAVAAARILTPALRSGRAPSLDVLDRVQRRRELPTRLTQKIQLLVQNRFIGRTIQGGVEEVPWLARLLDRSALLRRLPARFVGLGLRPEHVST